MSRSEEVSKLGELNQRAARQEAPDPFGSGAREET